ncbi:hypothetical protein G6F56_007779 [Rhizopus delemar]|nr:hypothetical protein G6F56_007779 [Rhizopus delemar]
MSQHHQKANVSHAEAALNAGRPYEKQKSHGEMFDTYQELQEHNRMSHGSTMGQSRGSRVDQELAAEDEETISKMNKANERKAQGKHAHDESL